jgi:hypothetical protein
MNCNLHGFSPFSLDLVQPLFLALLSLHQESPESVPAGGFAGVVGPSVADRLGADAAGLHIPRQVFPSRVDGGFGQRVIGAPLKSQENLL